MSAVVAAPETKEPEPKFRVIDGVMIWLAFVSVTLVLVDIFARHWLYDWGVFLAVVVVDLLITLVFVGDFVVEARGKSAGRVLREQWFDLVGLVPLLAFVALEAWMNDVAFMDAITGAVRLGGGAAAAGGLIRLFRLVRIVRIVAAFSRFLRATNMTFGEQVTKKFFDKYRRIIVAELTTPIMVAGITVTQEVVIRMKFLESVGQALDSKRPEIHAAVVEALQKNKVPQDILANAIVERVVADVEKTVVDTVVATLTGPELNALTQKTIVEILENFKKQLTSEEGKAMLRGLGEAPKPATVAPVPT